MTKPLISIFTPAFNEEENVLLVYEAVKSVMSTVSEKYCYEHVFSDNASTDHTAEILLELAKNDKHMKIILLAKNFGPAKSTFNGLGRCKGEAIIQLDADLQEPPSMILTFLEKWELGYKVVYGVWSDRKENWLMKSTRKIYYFLANMLSNETLIPMVGDFRLIDRRVLNEVKKVKDYNPYLRGIIANIGFEQIGIPYVRENRTRGKSSMTLPKLIDYGINGIISHSTILLRLSTIIGTLILLGSLGYIGFVILSTLLVGGAPPGIPAVLVIILFLSGVQLTFLGLIGEYIGRIFQQSIERPLVVEKDLVGFDN
jgi:polyisoprenyl-phosphate glycosyltransferase